MTKKIKAIAFDLDGLMVNTEDIYDDVCQSLLSRRKLSFDQDLKRRMMGRPGRVAIQIMKDELRMNESVEELQSEVAEIFHQIMPGTVKCLPGLADLLQFLEDRSLPKCVATSSFRRHAEEVLQECQLFSRFDFVLTSEDVQEGKPHPEIYLLAAATHQVDPAEMLVLEDSVLGSQAGVASGALTVAVPGRHSLGMDYGHVEHVASSLADRLIYDLIDGLD